MTTKEAQIGLVRPVWYDFDGPAVADHYHSQLGSFNINSVVGVNPHRAARLVDGNGVGYIWGGSDPNAWAEAESVAGGNSSNDTSPWAAVPSIGNGTFPITECRIQVTAAISGTRRAAMETRAAMFDDPDATRSYFSVPDNFYHLFEFDMLSGSIRDVNTGQVFRDAFDDPSREPILRAQLAAGMWINFWAIKSGGFNQPEVTTQALIRRVWIFYDYDDTVARSTAVPVTRQYPRDDGAGLSSARRIHPPPKNRARARWVGGYD